MLASETFQEVLRSHGGYRRKFAESIIQERQKMKKALFAAAALGALAMSSAYAADEKMYLSTMQGKHMVMGGANTEGSEVVMGESGAKPANCPAGSYYMTDSSQQMVMACDDDAKFSLSAPESGAMMSNGEPYPEGSMMMTPAQ